jgi:hypothetical protein
VSDHYGCIVDEPIAFPVTASHGSLADRAAATVREEDCNDNCATGRLADDDGQAEYEQREEGASDSGAVDVALEQRTEESEDEAKSSDVVKCTVEATSADVDVYAKQSETESEQEDEEEVEAEENERREFYKNDSRGRELRAMLEVSLTPPLRLISDHPNSDASLSLSLFSQGSQRARVGANRSAIRHLPLACKYRL